MKRLLEAIKNKIEQRKKNKQRKKLFKRVRRVFRRLAKRENLTKLLVIATSLILIGSGILPYLFR